MKKLLSLSLAAMLAAMMLAGCSQSGSSSSTAPVAPAGSTASTPTASTPAANDAVAEIKAKGKIVMATNAAFPPFEYIKDTKVAGVDADIAAEIAKDLGVELQIDDMEFNGIIPAVNSGKADFGAAGMTINPDRQKEVDFSVEYVKSAQYVIIVKGSGVTADQLKNAGVKIGAQEGTTGQFYAVGEECKNDEASADVLGYENALVAAQDLMNGKVQAVIIDKLPAENIVKANPDKLELLPESLTEESYAIAVKKGNTALLDAINSTLNRLIAEGKVDEFVITHAGA